MPLKVELNAVKKNFMKLMKLPVKDLLPALKMADVVSDDQREQMNAMTLNKDRAGYLLDNVIIPSLKLDIREPFYNFLQVLEDDDNPVVIAIVKDLRSSLRPSMPPQPPGPPVHSSYQGYSPYQGQASPQHTPYQGPQYSPYSPQTPPQQLPYQGQTPPQYPPYQGQPMMAQPFQPHHGQMPMQQSYPYHGQTPPQYPPYQGPQNPPYQGQMPPQYPQYQGPQNPPYQGQTPPQYPPYQGPQNPPYQGQTPPQYPPYQGQTSMQQSSPYQGQTTPQNPPYQGPQNPPHQGPQYPPHQGQPMMPQPPQPHHGWPNPQPCGGGGGGMIEVESYLKEGDLKLSSKRDFLPANNRNVHAVCSIQTKNLKGTGFIANLTMPNTSSPVTVLVTNNHVIKTLDEALEATYQFSYLRSDSDDTPHPIRGVDLILRNNHGFYTCEECDGGNVLLDYTLIQVNDAPLNNTMIKSELDGQEFPLSTCKFDLDKLVTPSGNEEMETISILHYYCGDDDCGDSLKRSTHCSITVGHLLFYACDTGCGSSGAPVFKVVNEQVQLIALHRGYWENRNFNFGTLITKVIEHVKNGGSPTGMSGRAIDEELKRRPK